MTEETTKKISFGALQELVANIDYLSKDSYPVVFIVDGKEYSCGIEYGSEERQYLADSDNNVLDLQDPDCMEWDAIGKMLREKCNIASICSKTITLLTSRSFNGYRPGLDEEIEAYEESRRIKKRKTAKMRNKQIHNFWRQNKSLKERLVMNGLYSTRLDEPVEISINSIFNDEFKPETVNVDEIRLTYPDLNLDIRGGGSHVCIADMYDGNDFGKIEKAVVGQIAKLSYANP